jgi:hypothetical protein
MDLIFPHFVAFPNPFFPVNSNLSQDINYGNYKPSNISKGRKAFLLNVSFKPKVLELHGKLSSDVWEYTDNFFMVLQYLGFLDNWGLSDILYTTSLQLYTE